MLDQTDIKILDLLKRNSRMQWQEVGEEVHLTGQAVKNRIIRMEKLGVIEGYTLRINDKKIGKNLTAFITVFMKTTDHIGFQKYIKDNEFIVEGNRISGEGCYMLKAIFSTQEEMLKVLDEILKFGNYKVNLSIENIK